MERISSIGAVFPYSTRLLDGDQTTRDRVMKLARGMNIEIREQPMPREMLYLADEMFFTGTAAEITPIRSVDGITVRAGGRGPVTAELQQRFFGLFDGSQPDRHGWLSLLKSDSESRTQELPHVAHAV